MSNVYLDAYQEGYDGYVAGYCFGENPYSNFLNPELHDNWNEGWETAQNDELFRSLSFS